MYVINTPHPTPLVKWAGGKAKMLPELLRHMPESFDALHVPFAGGLALFLAVDRPGFISDSNRSLIQFYKTVAARPYDLTDWLVDLQEAYNEYDDKRHFYEAVRKEFNLMRTVSVPDIIQAGRFLFLNKCGYNGLFRVNQSGEFNVPWGKKKKLKLLSEAGKRNLLAVSELFFRCAIHRRDYEEALKPPRPNDLVYCDPPYFTEGDGFTSYDASSRDWSKGETHTEMRNHLEKLADKGILVMLTNADVPHIRNLYRNWYIREVEMPRRIGAKAERRGRHIELIITSYRPEVG